jgi:hypothetical protein
VRLVYRGAVEIQNQIKRALSERKSMEIIRRLPSDGVYEYRSTFADAVCQHFGFQDARGRVQRSGCVKALRELERLGRFALPVASPMGAKGAKSPRRLGAPVEDPHGVPGWIGRDVAKRREHLHRVVAMSRFLIRPSVRCHHPASRVLGRVLRQIDLDCEAMAGFQT